MTCPSASHRFSEHLGRHEKPRYGDLTGTAAVSVVLPSPTQSRDGEEAVPAGHLMPQSETGTPCCIWDIPIRPYHPAAGTTLGQLIRPQRLHKNDRAWGSRQVQSDAGRPPNQACPPGQSTDPPAWPGARPAGLPRDRDPARSQLMALAPLNSFPGATPSSCFGDRLRTRHSRPRRWRSSRTLPAPKPEVVLAKPCVSASNVRTP